MDSQVHVVTFMPANLHLGLKICSFRGKLRKIPLNFGWASTRLPPRGFYRVLLNFHFITVIDPLSFSPLSYAMHIAFMGQSALSSFFLIENISFTLNCCRQTKKNMET